MTNECARAISVANHYFMLADRIIPGLENHLSKNVVLEWFGRKITGKKNVASFIMSYKTESFHTFHDIIPILDITTKKKESNRSRESLDQNASDKCETHTSYCSRKELTRCSHETEESTNHENAIDSNEENNGNDTTFVYKNGSAACNIEELPYKLEIMTACNDANVNVNVNTNIEANQNEITIANIDDQSDNLNKNDLCNLFEPEITSQAIVENINRTELKEEMAPTIRAINRECGQGDGPVIVEADTTKYLEANGTIKFLRINIQEDSLFLYHWTKIWKRKNWNQKCRLQIAYSLLIDNESPKIVKKCMQEKVHSANSHLNKIEKSKLPSLEEVIQDNSTLIRDKNYFNGYLQPLNFSKDREEFLKFFKAEMQEKFNAQSCARYVRNKLILDYPNKKPLLNVMYQIHMIIYTKIE